jgi:DNA-directed RNA polymerase specialized sigma24 family protein
MISDQPRRFGAMPLARHLLYLLYNHADAGDLVRDCLAASVQKKASLRNLSKRRGCRFWILNNLFLDRHDVQVVG